ncbi:MAG: ring-1,2-phenylacetyl-CoA epoxidase subunit PaaC [Bacteroidetes bacterium]|nr:MAG: ring-1,2-phenylacetyl-CoA epoxidase subunit PaaC [Bacteroidota bacterium]
MNKQEALIDYCLRLGDNSLVLGHRLSEWCGHGPILEEDLALANIALDLLGQTRNLFTYAAAVEGKGRTEDDLAYTRNNYEFRNALLTEQANGDFAVTIARQLFYTSYAWLLFTELQKSKDETIAGIAAKALKETSYHLRHCNEWTIRLGDGTEESHRRMQDAVDSLWMYTDDIFAQTEGDALLIKEGIAADAATLKPKWDAMIKETLTKATLKMPEGGFMMKGSREGKHTEHLTYILGELQFLQRTYPGMEW